MSKRVMAVAQRLQNLMSSPTRGALLGALLVLVLLLPVWWLSGRWYQAQLLKEAQSEASLEASLRGNALSLAINRRLARLQGLYAFVQTEMQDEHFESRFETFAAGLYMGSRGIRNLAVAPGGVVRFVYPLASNETTIGYEPLNDRRPSVRADVQRAVQSGQVVLTGPVELIQGGEGLIARQAVYQEGTFWGLVNVVLDMPTMLVEAGLDGQPSDLDFALRDNDDQFLHGLPGVFESDPVVTRVELTEETWELAAVPTGGWTAAVRQPLVIFRTVTLITVGLLAGVTYLSINRQAQLALAIQQRTQELVQAKEQLEQDIARRERTEAALLEREAQYRSIFESVNEALFIIDLEGRLVDLNPAAARMHGYSHQEFRQLQPAQFIHPDSLPLFVEFIETIKAGGQFRGRAVDLHKDGTPFHVEVIGTAFAYRGQPHTLAVVRDITAEVQAVELLEQRVDQRTRELATLLEVSHDLASTLDLESLLDLILDRLGVVVDYSGAALFAMEGTALRILNYRGPIPQDQIPRHYFLATRTRIADTVIHRREPHIIDDVRGDERVARTFQTSVDDELETTFGHVRSWMGVPLMVKERMIGLLSLSHSEPNHYTARHARLALAIANQAATAIENARLYEGARRLAVLEERQRLARELHDSVSQALYGIGLGARTARTLLDRATVMTELKSALIEPLDYVLSLADAGLAEMRALLFELRPDSLEKEGLAAALTRQAAAFRVRHDLEVHTAFGEEPSLPFETKEALYRVAMEALNNTVKHAQASRVDIRLDSSKGAIVLEVWDDGVGFDPQDEYPGHMGLHSMQERTARVGGRLEIKSAPGQGTRVQVCIPMDEAA